MIDFGPCRAPSELEFLEAFGVEPIESRPTEGYWAYEFEGAAGVRVRLSFDLMGGWVQTEVICGGAVVATVVHEMAEEIAIDERTGSVRARFGRGRGEVKVSMEVRVRPALEVQWAGSCV